MDALKADGRRTSSGSTARLAGGLVVAQVALSLVLVLTAGLLVRPFVSLATRPLGFGGSRGLAVAVDTARAHVDAAERVPFYAKLAEALASVPGVERAAASLWVPLGAGGAYLSVNVPDGPQLPDRHVIANVVMPGWLATYGTSLRDGRDFTDG